MPPAGLGMVRLSFEFEGRRVFFGEKQATCLYKFFRFWYNAG
ncbi:MAG: hypothetical protein ACNA7H_03845 [Desulfotignum sp.]